MCSSRALSQCDFAAETLPRDQRSRDLLYLRLIPRDKRRVPWCVVSRYVATLSPLSYLYLFIFLILLVRPSLVRSLLIRKGLLTVVRSFYATRIQPGGISYTRFYDSYQIRTHKDLATNYYTLRKTLECSSTTKSNKVCLRYCSSVVYKRSDKTHCCSNN